MEGLHELTKEVNRIVTAPYLVNNLKRLASILALISDRMLLQWANSKACQLAPLADVVRAATPEVSAPIVTRLAILDDFRTHLMQHPTCIEQLLRIAGERLLDGTKAASWDASVALLSHTLPGQVALPESVCSLVEQMVEDVVQFPNMDHLCRMYNVLSNQSIYLLCDLPVETLPRFISSCKGILPAKADTLRNLLCFAIYAMAAEPKASTSSSSPFSMSSDTPKPSIVFRQWQESANRLFQEKKGYKIVSLTVLGVTVLCSDCQRSSTALRHVLYAIHAATSILGPIQPRLTSDWLSENMDVLRRLETKLSNDEADPAIRCAGFRFCCTLLRSNCEMSLARDVLDQLVKHDASFACLEDIMSMLFDCVRNVPDHVQTILGYAIDQCFPGRFEGLKVTKVRVATLLIEALRSSTDATVCQQVLAHICQKGVPDWWNLDLQPENREENCGMLEHCPGTLQRIQYELKAAVSFLFIEKSWVGTTKLPPDVLTTVMHQVQDSRAVRSSWSCYYPCRLPHLPEPNAQPHIQPANASVNWQINLASDLQEFARRSYDLIVNRADEVCCDFETRCDHVEEPLRAASAQAEQFREERDIAHLELDSYRQQILDLEAALEEARCLRCAIEQKSGSLENELGAAMAREEILKRDLNEVERVLQQQEAESEITLHGMKNASKETLKDAISEHRTVVLGLQVELEQERENSSKVAQATEEIRQHMQSLMHEVSEKQTDDAKQAAQLHQMEMDNMQSEVSLIIGYARHDYC